METSSHGPFKGVRATCVGVAYAGPEVAKWMAALGAESIRIESSSRMEFTRGITLPGISDINASYAFNDVNRGLKSFGLDIDNPRSRPAVESLLRKTDVFIENVGRRTIARYNLDYETVAALRPDIIYISLPGFGNSGPYSDFRTFGPNLPFHSGLASIWSLPGEDYPVGTQSPLPDHIVGKYGLIAIVAALASRKRNGRGQFIEVAQIEMLAALVGEHYMSPGSRAAKPLGNRHDRFLQGAYPCKGTDRWVVVGIRSNEEWRLFCSLIGKPQLFADPSFATLADCLAHQDTIDEHIQTWTLARTAEDAVCLLRPAGIACAMVSDARDYAADTRVVRDGSLVEIDHPVVGRRQYPALPLRTSDLGIRQDLRAPLLGEHTREVCRDVLAMTEREVEELLQEGVLEACNVTPNGGPL